VVERDLWEFDESSAGRAFKSDPARDADEAEIMWCCFREGPIQRQEFRCEARLHPGVLAYVSVHGGKNCPFGEDSTAADGLTCTYLTSSQNVDGNTGRDRSPVSTLLSCMGER
jgi:hypothetical protein